MSEQQKKVRIRRAYTRVFDPRLGEKCSQEDRELVLEDLRDHCKYDEEFFVSVDSPNAALQLAGQEGRRGVYLRIMGAIAKGQDDMMKEPQTPSQAITE